MSAKTAIIIWCFRFFYVLLQCCLFIPQLVLTPVFRYMYNTLIKSRRAPCIPVSTSPQSSTYAASRRSANGRSRKPRVAIIGGGIAGSTAAYQLTKEGFEVEVFERKHMLGGNANVIDWQVGDELIRTGLSVLAWPTQYFRNYRCLLDELGIQSTRVQLPFLIGKDACSIDGKKSESPHDPSQIFSNDDPSTSLYVKYHHDIQKWRDLVELIRGISAIAHKTTETTLYGSSPLNPFNYLRLKTMMWIYGISAGFYRDIFLPVYTSSFLTGNLDNLPAIIAPMIQDIIPLHESPTLDTWFTNSSEVFSKLTAHVASVHTNAEVLSVDTTKFQQQLIKEQQQQQQHHSGTAQGHRSQIENGIAITYGIIDDNFTTYDMYTNNSPNMEIDLIAGVDLERDAAKARQHNVSGLDHFYIQQRKAYAAKTAVTRYFDRVIFACPGETALSLLTAQSVNPLQKLILSTTEWCDDFVDEEDDDDDRNGSHKSGSKHGASSSSSSSKQLRRQDETFVYGVIHSDPNILPASHKDTILAKYSNYIHITLPPTDNSGSDAVSTGVHVSHAQSSSQDGTRCDLELSSGLSIPNTHSSSSTSSMKTKMVPSSSSSSHASQSTQSSSEQPQRPWFLPSLPSISLSFYQSNKDFTPWVSALPYVVFPSATADTIARSPIFLTLSQIVLTVIALAYGVHITLIKPIVIRPLSSMFSFDTKYYDSPNADGHGVNFHYENTFVLSSWIPAVQTKRENDPTADRPMLVTYHLHPSRQHLIAKETIHCAGSITNIRAHPHMNMNNLLLGQAVRLIQGLNGCYFASSWTTVCTGHDLSLLSGLMVSSYITGSLPKWPVSRVDPDQPVKCTTPGFKDEDVQTIPTDPEGAFRDLIRMQAIMGE